MRLRHSFAAVLLAALAAQAFGAQECPHPGGSIPPPGPLPLSTLHGKLLLHNGLRRWWGLQVSPPVCGSSEIQVIVNSGDDAEDRAQSRDLDTLRGCNVEITGPLQVPGTGYFSADLYVTRHEITPAPGCVRQPGFVDYTGSFPPANLRRYAVKLTFDYLPGDHPPGFVITAGKRHLVPWQPYAGYRLTGESILYAECGRDFNATSFTGAPAAHPWLIDGTVGLDPQRAAAQHVTHITVTYTCVRQRFVP